MSTTAIEEREDEVRPSAVEVDAAPDMAQLFRFSSWVHVGGGALECEAVDEEKGEVSCSSPTHFHAWCRLPNQFQHKEIRDRAMAAKARRARQLRDPDSNVGVVLEEALDSLRREAEREPVAKEGLVDELLSRDWHREYGEARREVEEERLSDAPVDGDEPLKWEHIRRDKARLVELHAMAEDQRSADEYEELGRHVKAYDDAVEAAYDQRMKPMRDSLMTRSVDDLIADLRELRIDRDANDEFMHVYAANEWLECTLTHPNGARRFRSFEQMSEAADEVVRALELTFSDLERSSVEPGWAEGNS